MKYVFGPVTSSRLGRSLGLDLLGKRICSMDCLYCEVGKTDTLTMERAEYVPANHILDELAQWRRESDLVLDYVTLGGMGEPCLNSALPEIIRGARDICPGTPVAVLINSTLLTDPAVRAELVRADALLPSLDSLVEKEFAAINRPAPGLTAAAVAQGLLDLRREFTGHIYLEILLAKGVNDSDENLALLRGYVNRLRPDRVDVVTLSRPGTAPGTKGVDADTLERWRNALGHRGDSQPLRHAGQSAPEHDDGTDEQLTDAVLASLARRPQTAAQMGSALGTSTARLKIILETLAKQGHIRRMSSENLSATFSGATENGQTADDIDRGSMDGETFYGPIR